jgi:hypothetical protein
MVVQLPGMLQGIDQRPFSNNENTPVSCTYFRCSLIICHTFAIGFGHSSETSLCTMDLVYFIYSIPKWMKGILNW